MSGQHTPGKWELGRGDGAAAGMPKVVRGGGQDICSAIYVGEPGGRADISQTWANMALIAKAPEMLAVLEKLSVAWSSGITPVSTQTLGEGILEARLILSDLKGGK